MNIDIELNNYIADLSSDEKNLLLIFLKKFTGNKGSEYSKAILQYNLELEAAVEEIRNGNYLNHDEVLKESVAW